MQKSLLSIPMRRHFRHALFLGGTAWLIRLACQRDRYCFRNKVVVITGGSRGLGIELARRWGEEGARVAICARTEVDVKGAVQELSRRGIDALGMCCDVTDRDAVQRFIQTVLQRWGTIHVLVNNAGVIQAGPAECMTLSDYRSAMETHFWAPLYAVDAVLPVMYRQQEGRIVNVASIGGKISVPHLLPYCASKFALLGLSEGLRNSLSQHGIHVTTVCPGLMRTGSPRNAQFKGQHRDEYAWFSISDSLPGVTISSASAARTIVEACRRGDAEVVLSLPAKAAVKVHAVFPALTARLLGWVNRLLPAAGGSGLHAHQGKESFSRWSPSWMTRLTEKAAIKNREV